MAYIGKQYWWEFRWTTSVEGHSCVIEVQPAAVHMVFTCAECRRAYIPVRLSDPRGLPFGWDPLYKRLGEHFVMCLYDRDPREPISAEQPRERPTLIFAEIGDFTDIL